ncbi:MAG: DEAD/DEAH box helicase [Clostridia bacterium]|nr:DEAD/DEAH box helicase [Clostridia bacterium]
MIKVGDLLFNNIASNEYLHYLFNKTVENYSYSILDNQYAITLTQKEKMDALRFADILSKCTNEAQKDKLFNWAQDIVTRLNKLYPNDELIKYYLGSVLSNVNNYFGLTNNCDNYVNSDLVECAREYLVKEEYAIPGEKGSYFINKQSIAYDNMKRSESYSFSAPTSLGKTFIIRMFIKECILSGEKANFVIVVPTNALINEIYNDIINDLKDNLDLNNYKVVKSPAAIVGEDDKFNYIMVYTQERLLYHLLKVKDQVVNYLFIDEAHKISVGEGRSAFFYKIMSIINKQYSSARIYFSCPNIPNPQVYLDLVSDNLNRASTRIRYSPVNQNKIIIDHDSHNLFYYSEVDEDFNVLEDVPETFPWGENIIQIVQKLGKGKSNIVFCNTKNEAVQWANEFSSLLDEIENDELNELIEEVKEEIHEDCYLAKTLKRRVAYHVAYIPTRIKEKIEDLFKKGIIQTVFCTSTLLEGVNFPAENLFLMLKSSSPWLKDESRVDFKNLVGRVGRIEFNMFGNIFFISDNSTFEKYKRAINLDVQDQKLSIEYYLSTNRKKDIVKTLLEGKTSLEKKGTYEELNFARYALNMLLKDIVNGNKSKVSKIFEDVLTTEDATKIKELFKENKYLQDDLVTTADQIEEVDRDINLKKLTYPKEISFKNTFEFLSELHRIFNWGKYESKTELGKIERLKYFSVILQQWICGFGVQQIIESTIDWHRRKGQIYIDGQYIDFDDSLDQRNHIINDVLNTLENIIQFKLKNYFLKFSERKIECGQDIAGNDWYEFVEYGSNNYRVILLQKIGFSRESALYINRERAEMIKMKDGKIVHLDNDLMKYRKISKEVEQVKYNNKKLFI